jgi:hypothetical protein
VLFLFTEKTIEEQVGEPFVRGVRGEVTRDKREDLRRGSWGWGRTMESGVRPFEVRLGCIGYERENEGIV